MSVPKPPVICPAALNCVYAANAEVAPGKAFGKFAAGRLIPEVPMYPVLRLRPRTVRSTVKDHVARYALRKSREIADALRGLMRWLGERAASACSNRLTSQTVLSGTRFESPEARMLMPAG